MNIATVAQQAGVWVETVEHFVRRGLLPRGEPYTAEHVALLRLVVRFQAEHQLALDDIRSVVVDECAFDLARAEVALGARVEPDPSQAGPGPVSRSRLAADTGASAALLDALSALGALPEQGPYGGHHAWMATSAHELITLGVTAEAAERATALGMEVAAMEIDALLGDVGRGEAPRVALRDSRERRAAVGHLLTAARNATTAAQLAKVARATEGSKEVVLVATHVPSPLFIARHRLDEAEALMRARVAGADPSDRATASGELVQLLVGLGRFEDALQAAEPLVDQVIRLNGEPPTSPMLLDVLLYRGLCHSLLGDDRAALQAVHLAERGDPLSPKAAAFVSAAHFVAAGRAPDLLDATVHVETALAALARSRGLPARSRVEQAEARLTTGRIALVLPESFALSEAGVADLEAVLHATSEPDAAEVGYGVRGARDLVRVTALFFLGSRWASQGDPRAEALLREVIALDPVSNFARMAWRRLSVRADGHRGADGRTGSVWS